MGEGIHDFQNHLGGGKNWTACPFLILLPYTSVTASPACPLLPPWDWATQISLLWVQGQQYFRTFPRQPLCLELSLTPQMNMVNSFPRPLFWSHTPFSVWPSLTALQHSMHTPLSSDLYCLLFMFLSAPLPSTVGILGAGPQEWAGPQVGGVLALSGWCSVLSSCWIAETFVDASCAQSPEISLLMVKAKWGPASLSGG